MSQVEMMASKAQAAQTGAEGAQRLIIVDDDKFVVSTNMKVGAYTVAAQPIGPTIVSVLQTAVGTADTSGKITVVGTDATGATISEDVVPVAGTTIASTKAFSTITSITGSGWVIDAGSGNDTIKIGSLTSAPPAGYYFSAIQVLTTTVVASQTNVTGAVTPSLSGVTGLIASNIYPVKCTRIGLTSGEAFGYIAKL
jgi:hypothetical protein